MFMSSTLLVLPSAHRYLDESWALLVQFRRLQYVDHQLVFDLEVAGVDPSIWRMCVCGKRQEVEWCRVRGWENVHSDQKWVYWCEMGIYQFLRYYLCSNAWVEGQTMSD